MEENITDPNIFFFFFNIHHISENIKAAVFLKFSSVNLKLLKLYCLQHCDKRKFLHSMCFHMCMDASVCLHIYYDGSVQKILVTVIREDHVIFKIYVLVYHDSNTPARTCTDYNRLCWVLSNGTGNFDGTKLHTLS